MTGIDPSDGQIDYARKRPGTKMAQFRVAGAQELPFADNTFDAASMALVITFVPDAVRNGARGEAGADVIRVRIAYDDFNYFWESNTLPVGPSGKTLHELPPSEKERLKAHVRGMLPVAPDGRIAYEAFANAVKGRAPRIFPTWFRN